nr:adenosylcobinamide-GDP ribazoletransferase [Rhodophyticola porphyridii]
MPDGDMTDQRLVHPADLRIAMVLLTRLPLPARGDDPARGAQAAWAWPLAGLVLGGFGALVLWVGGWLGLPPGISAALALAIMILASGALHEDGLADTADGFWGGWTVERRLEIMRDSRIGTYGVLALGLGLLARWSLIGVAAVAGPVALITAAVISRAPMVALMAMLRPARKDGLSQSVGRPAARTAALAAAIAGVIAIALAGWAGAMALIMAYAVTAGLGLLARARIGGQTGDVLGASQQLAEIAALTVIVTALI